MAFCTNCGASLPDGTAFCTSCGAKLAPAPAPKPAAPAYAAPAYAAPAGYPAPAPKKKHTGLIIGIIAAVLVAAAVLVLFLTGVLGDGLSLFAPKQVGTWSLVSSTDSTLLPGNVTAVLTKDGKGYIAIRSTVVYDEEVSFTLYSPLTWTDNAILIDGQALFYTRDKDTITVTYDGATMIFNRTGGVEKRTALKPGTFTAISGKHYGQDASADDLKGYTITLSEGGFGTANYGSNSKAVTWDDYFISTNGSQVFYTYDGTTLTLEKGPITMVFTRVG
jgi:hypothetical protein